MNQRIAAFIIISAVVFERLIVLITISILRESPEFIVHLAYALLFDVIFTTSVILFVLVCQPWLSRLRIGRITNVHLEEGIVGRPDAALLVPDSHP